MAELTPGFTEDTIWLGNYSKAPAKVLREYLAGRNLPALHRLRRLMKDFFFEYEMYKNPDQDLALLERTMYQKYLLVTPEEDEPHAYASSIWYTSYPCYYQNYILSGMIATQLQEALTNKFGRNKFTDSSVAGWMIQHLYRDGETESGPNVSGGRPIARNRGLPPETRHRPPAFGGRGQPPPTE